MACNNTSASLWPSAPLGWSILTPPQPKFPVGYQLMKINAKPYSQTHVVFID
jgi:hypothetical protein